MAKTKLFESWTFRLQLPPPFDDPKYSGAKPMGFSQYNTSSTAQKATLHHRYGIPNSVNNNPKTWYLAYSPL